MFYVDPDPLSASYRLVDIWSMANVLQQDTISIPEPESLEGTLLRLTICHAHLYLLNLVERIELRDFPLKSLWWLLSCLQLIAAHTIVKVKLNPTQLSIHIKIVAYRTYVHLLLEPFILQLAPQGPAQVQLTTFIANSFQLKSCIASNSLISPRRYCLAIVAHQQQVCL